MGMDRVQVSSIEGNRHAIPRVTLRKQRAAVRIVIVEVPLAI